MINFYEDDHEFDVKPGDHATTFQVVDEDTFTEASKHESACCLNFASHKRPGGGYRAVRHLRMPIKTQEEDLFRRSDLPEIMDNPEVRRRYPLKGIQGFFCTATVTKDKSLDPVVPFEVGVVTVPAVVNPGADYALAEKKLVRVLEIAAHADVLILGAWGCGVFNNDPKKIATLFKKHLTGKFAGAFKKVVFAVPGASSANHKIFREEFPNALE